MATNHTENYQLNLWEPQDSFLREEFNENTEKIDAALENYKFASGTYVADGVQKNISLGFQPSVVLIMCKSATTILVPGLSTTSYCEPIYNRNAKISNSAKAAITDDGFTVEASDSYYNNASYAENIYYIAFR